MSEQVEAPTWDLADRLRKALRQADMSVNEMAGYLEVGRNTVSSWINGRHRPSPQTVRLWAIRTGVSYEWLKEGDLGVRKPGCQAPRGAWAVAA